MALNHRHHSDDGEAPNDLARRDRVGVPKYRLHKPTGQAVVTLGGRDFYLGKHGTKASKDEYRRRVGEFLAAGGVAPNKGDEFTIAELVLRYWKHVETYYPAETRDGTIKPILKRLRKLYGPTAASEFGPIKLKAFRLALIDEVDEGGRRLSRPYVNRAVRMVRTVFKWAVGEELIDAAVFHGLQAVEGLRYGRTDAPEPPPVSPVSDADVEATLPYMPRVVADMVRVQRLTGMRPGELCAMTAAEIDTTGEVWIYTPRHHKTAHHGKKRVVPIGPRAQEILRPYLCRDLTNLTTPTRIERGTPETEGGADPTHGLADRDACRELDPRAALIEASTKDPGCHQLTTPNNTPPRRGSRGACRDRTHARSLKTPALASEGVIARVGGPVFSPLDSERLRKLEMRGNNRTPFTPSRRARDAARARKPKRPLNSTYSTTNYAQVIRRACDAAGIPRWSPNQLRHTKATEIRKEFGLDVAGAVLGHTKLETTQIYAERSKELAIRAALATG